MERAKEILCRLAVKGGKEKNGKEREKEKKKKKGKRERRKKKEEEENENFRSNFYNGEIKARGR